MSGRRPMKRKEDQSNEIAKLRGEAEAIFRERTPTLPEDLQDHTPEEVKRMLHELRVHQLELEMQNEELRRAQVELDAARARYFDLYDLAPAGYCTLSDTGLILEANLTAATLLGVNRSALIKRRFAEFIFKEDGGALYLRRRQLSESGHPQSCELRMVKKGGAVFWARLAMSAAHDTDGQPVCRVMICDITEERQSEGALRASEAKYRAFFDNSMDAMLLTSPDGSVYAANPAACQMFGRTEREIIEAGRSGLVDPTDTALPGFLSERAAAGKVRGELTMLRGDGTSFPAEISSALFKDSNNETRTSMIFRDISERKQAEAALRASEERVRSIFRAAPIGIGCLADRVFLSVNQRFCQMLGYAAEELVGQNARMIYPTDNEFQYVGQEKYRQIKERGIGSVETRFVRKDGQVLDVLLSSAPIDVDDLSKGVTFTAEDITERKQAEAALATYQKQLQMLALKLERREDEERRRIAAYLHDQVGQSLAAVRVKFATWKGMKAAPSRETLLSEIEQLIDSTIDETRMLTFDLSPPILYELGLGPALERLGETCCEKEGIAFIFHDDGRNGRLSEVLASALYRIARELLLNVVKHAKAERASLSLSVDAREIRLAVEDNGMGIEREQCARALGGLGGTYGLFSIRERVQHLGGRIELVSNPGEGTRATVVVPFMSSMESPTP